MKAIGIETVGMTMRFGAFTALDGVSMRAAPGTVHALLGENGAGKSTLVKCIMGFYHATEGRLLVDGQEVEISDPIDAQRYGLGMVYQHFTLVPSLTGAENLVINRADAPRVIDWPAERQKIAEFLEDLPFHPELDQPVSRLSAGEKQKLEIVKQLYLGNRFLILDEPTSVLTPSEADEMLSHVRDLCANGEISVLLITHKFREVRHFANDVTVLRRGLLAGGGKVSDLSDEQLAELMMGDAKVASAPVRQETKKNEVLLLKNAVAAARSGNATVHIDELRVRSGEIVGLAGISGNGQTELMEMLTGQRPLISGSIEVDGKKYGATREESRSLKVRYLPEEPLKNAVAPRMSVAENLAFRDFDASADGPRYWMNRSGIERAAREHIEAFNIKTTSPHSPISALSGGNVQRTVLARELSGEVRLLIVANPCFGLDFKAVAAVRQRLIAARNQGVAILLISEDLDEIMELSDRLVTISEGRITYSGKTGEIGRTEIGSYIAGHG